MLQKKIKIARVCFLRDVNLEKIFFIVRDIKKKVKKRTMSQIDAINLLNYWADAKRNTSGREIQKTVQLKNGRKYEEAVCFYGRTTVRTKSLRKGELCIHYKMCIYPNNYIEFYKGIELPVFTDNIEEWEELMCEKKVSKEEYDDFDEYSSFSI